MEKNSKKYGLNANASQQGLCRNTGDLCPQDPDAVKYEGSIPNTGSGGNEPCAFDIKNLTFKYPGRNKPALCSINLKIQTGKMVLICGRSGSGKSTLLRNLKPALTPAGERSGTVEFCGIPLEKMSKRDQAARIGYVLQDPDAQIVTDKVWHELAFGLENLGIDNETIRLRVAEIANFFGIHTWFERDVNTLSGGQKQMLNLAAVMAMQPEVLILDEPTSQLDPIAADDFIDAVVKINRELGTTVIMTEHRLEKAFQAADRAVVLDGGMIIADGTPSEAGTRLSEMNHPMFSAMPAPVRVYGQIHNSGIGAGDECPSDVREGRMWLSRLMSGCNISVKSLPERNHEPEEVNAGETAGAARRNFGIEKLNQTAVLEMKDVWFRYDKNGDDVIKDLSMTVYDSELLCIVGGNGSGKSTAVSIAAGLRKPYRGKVKQYRDNIAVLPQNPQTIFVKNTVREDLAEMLEGRTVSDDYAAGAGKNFNSITVKSKEDEIETAVNKVADLTDIRELLDIHPYDLSGGEQQRAALAKVLLSNPDILFLDEPTKGLDSGYKESLANILKDLRNRGVAVVVVSHDIEFCAMHADRCDMFFNGGIISSGRPRAFFSGNNFYTTAANRMSRHIFENAVTAEDVAALIKVNINSKLNINNGKSDSTRGKHMRSGSGADIRPIDKGKPGTEGNVQHNARGASGEGEPSGMAAGNKCIKASGANDERSSRELSGSDSTASTDGMVGTDGTNSEDTLHSVCKPPVKGSRQPLRKHLVNILVLAAAAVTIYLEFFVFDHRHYMAVSILIIIYSMIPFFAAFEYRKPKAREVVIMAVLIATAVVGRAAFFMIPNFKPILAIVIISGVALGRESGFLIGAMSAFVSNFLFGQGPWTVWQMIAMAIIGYLAGMIFHGSYEKYDKIRLIPLIIYGTLTVFFLYGAIVDIWTILSLTPEPTLETIVTVYGAAFYFNLVHCGSTALFLAVLAKPMLGRLKRIRVKYGMGGQEASDISSAEYI